MDIVGFVCFDRWMLGNWLLAGVSAIETHTCLNQAASSAKPALELSTLQVRFVQSACLCLGPFVSASNKIINELSVGVGVGPTLPSKGQVTAIIPVLGTILLEATSQLQRWTGDV